MSRKRTGAAAGPPADLPPSDIPGQAHRSAAYRPGPPLLPVGQLGMAADDHRRHELERIDLLATLYAMETHLSNVLRLRREHILVAPCEDDASVMGVVPCAAMVTGLLTSAEIGAVSSVVQRRLAERHKQEVVQQMRRVFARGVHATPGAAVRTPRMPHGASTTQLKAHTHALYGVSMAAVVEACATPRRSVRRKGQRKPPTRPAKRKPKGTAARPAVRRKHGAGSPADPLAGPRVITSASLQAESALNHLHAE
jgi:hypothetical protein